MRNTPVQSRLLVVDDEPNQLITLRDVFESEGFAVVTCKTCEEALEHCREHDFAVAILDLRLSDDYGIEVLKELRKVRPQIRAIIHTGYGSFDSAKDAVNLGAFAYVEKAGNPADLVLSVHRAVKERLSETLDQAERQYRELVNDVAAVVWEKDIPSGEFTVVSRQAESIFGYPVTRWLEDSDFWVRRVHSDDRDRYTNSLDRCISAANDEELDYRVENSAGETVWVHDVVHLVCDADGRPSRIRGVMFDMTRQRESELALRAMQAQLAHVARLSTMGEMVAGIAHEVNQPLSIIANFAQASKHAIEGSSAQGDTPVGEWMQIICSEARNCAEIIQGLRSFVQKERIERERSSLVAVLDDSIKLIQFDQRNRTVRIVVGSADDEAWVQINRVQIQQVIVNLLQNALDATESVEEPAVVVTISLLPKTVRLTVQDNGVGIKADEKGKLFDAFFTTKENGLGMGLAISQTIVESHSGTLQCESGPDGTRFHMTLPRLQADGSEQSLSQVSVAGPASSFVD